MDVDGTPPLIYKPKNFQQRKFDIKIPSPSPETEMRLQLENPHL
jgi:hypothetical protein